MNSVFSKSGYFLTRKYGLVSLGVLFPQKSLPKKYLIFATCDYGVLTKESLWKIRAFQKYSVTKPKGTFYNTIGKKSKGGGNLSIASLLNLPTGDLLIVFLSSCSQCLRNIESGCLLFWIVYTVTRSFYIFFANKGETKIGGWRTVLMQLGLHYRLVSFLM